MTLDRTLKTTGGMSKVRSVLKRSERIARLRDEGKFSDDESPLGLAKTKVRHSKAGMKSKKAEDKAAVATAEGAAPVAEGAAAPAAAVAPGAKAPGAKAPAAKPAEKGKGKEK